MFITVESMSNSLAGVQHPEKSVYLGDSGRGAEVPAYDVGEVLGSPAAAALRAAAPASWQPLTAADVSRLREKAMLGAACQEVSVELDLKCQPYCLFDLSEDPCETRDVRGQVSYQQAGDELLQRLGYWENLTVPQINQEVDLASDPLKHNGTWVSWMDDEPSAAGCAEATLVLTVAAALLAHLP